MSRFGNLVTNSAKELILCGKLRTLLEEGSLWRKKFEV